jgi:hypothetical protein
MPKSKPRQIHRCSCTTCQRHPFGTTAQQHRAINRVLATLDEKNRRRFAGLLAIQAGRHTRIISLLSQITGLSRNTIYRGQREIEHPTAKRRSRRVRAPGGGRPLTEKNNLGFLMRSMSYSKMPPLAIRSPG